MVLVMWVVGQRIKKYVYIISHIFYFYFYFCFWLIANQGFKHANAIRMDNFCILFYILSTLGWDVYSASSHHEK